MVNSPLLSVKIIVLTHFILTAWAMMHPFLGAGYLYMNIFLIAFGCWSIVCPESSESAFSFMVLNVISIIMDIIFLGVFTPEAHSAPGMQSLFRFSLAMAIINLILKPFTSFVVFRIYQDRGGQYGELNIPGIPTFGGSASASPGYENIDSTPTNNVETASPHNYSQNTGSQ